MAQGHDLDRKPRDVGSGSPASREAKEQGMSGARGGARAAQDPDGDPGQPAQASGRRGAQHEQPAEERKSFAPGQAPSEQGEKDHPSPHVIARHQQGIEGRSGSSGGAHDNRTEEESQRGEPRGGHARHGREHVSGDRPRE